MSIIEISILECDEGKLSRVGLGADLNEEPPEGVSEEEFRLFQLKELFRSALRETCGDKYRLDITRRGKVPDGLPH